MSSEPGPATHPPRSDPTWWRDKRVLVVTGRLAEKLVRRVVRELHDAVGWQAEVQVVGISVAALMHVPWLQRKLSFDPRRFDGVLLPGWCQGSLDQLAEQYGIPFELGPKDVLDLPEFLGRGRRQPPDLSAQDIEIVAEINHASRIPPAELRALAGRYVRDGADVIDLGCVPGERWGGVADAVSTLRSEGLRVSIDSFDRTEVEAAVDAGAELVLSCNASNRNWAAGLPAELVAIPDDPARLATLDETASLLQSRGAAFRLDPILEPVGFGFAASLLRYAEVRQRFPAANMLMGIGNVTELAEVDSAGLNFLLAAICQEWSIRSVLTTEVANWSRSSVREFDIARRLVKHAIGERALVKHWGTSLRLLRAEKLSEPGAEALEEMARQLTDPNVRIFVNAGRLHLMNRDGHWRGDDPFDVFERFLAESSGVDAAHAFYLGYEMAKATTALTLGKQYAQDEPLDWGFLTRPETSRHDRRRE